jgi:YidC/Oxa1 family membrane protein insertase
MERRVLLAISLSFLVLFLYQTFILPPPVPVEPRTAAPGEPPVIGDATPLGSPQARQTAPVTPDPEEAPDEPVVADTSEREIVIDTALVRATMTNRGGRVTSWILKEYRGEDGQPLDLVPTELPEGRTTPFALVTDDGLETRRLNESLYRVSVDGAAVDATTAPATIEFEFQAADGLRATKRFVFTPDSYIIRFSAGVWRGTEAVNPSVQWGPGLGDELARGGQGGFLAGAYAYPAQAIYYSDGSVERTYAKDLASQPVVEGAFRYGGVTDHYFVSSIVDPVGPVRFDFSPVSLPDPRDPTLRREFIDYTVRFASAPEDVQFFFGPKQFDVLRDIDPEFTRLIWFGISAPLSVPLLTALTFLHGYIGNWGWSIIVLTILINVVMFPLRHKSVVSMRKMQEIQPQMKAIQARYAQYKVTDPERQKMNTEVMALYKERGVNPASGCLPMLLTMPVLFAFYSLLSQAIEIRGADFGPWITDLSRHDPLYITPLLMGATMFWQMRITPSTADPTQQKVMQFMPVMFTFMFLWAPSGLVIYWFVSNVWAIGQQYFTNWLLGPMKVGTVTGPELHAERPAKPARLSKAERRMKSAGAGKTEEAKARK